MMKSIYRRDRKLVCGDRDFVQGYIDEEEKVFWMNRRPSRGQLLKHPEGWAIDCELFEHDIRPTCRYLVVRELDTNTLYSADIKTFEDYKVLIRRFRQSGPQWCLELSYWKTEPLV
jgi:hypothetical protein